VTFDEVVTRLEIGLPRELPGAAAHAILAPRPRREWPSGFNPARVRNAAGLLLVYPSGDTTRVVLTLRTETVRHAGQVSLPGGVVDPGETFEQAALREAHEEVGLSRDGVRVIGALSPLDIPVSGFRLHPIVAAIAHPPALRPSDGEVARILEVDLDELMAPSAVIESDRTRDGWTRRVPAFHVADVEIWGATAMVLAEFLTLLGWRPD
jgi:8-oxo-dGTP pyrophosphatase MutT (NUDIX family)